MVFNLEGMFLEEEYAQSANCITSIKRSRNFKIKSNLTQLYRKTKSIMFH